MTWLRNPWGRPRWLALITAMYVLWSVVPVLLAIAFAFNAGRSRTTWQGFSFRWFTGETGSVLHDPALDGRMVESHAALCHPCFAMAIAQGRCQIPPRSYRHEVLGEMGSFDTDRHRRSPSLWYPHPPSESIPQSGSNEKCARALFRPLRTMKGDRQP